MRFARRLLVEFLERKILIWQAEGEVARFEGIIVSDLQDDPSFRETVVAALELVKDSDLRRFQRIQRHIQWIVNVILPHGGARYSHSTRTCKIDFEKSVWEPYANDKPLLCASMLVHEATHGVVRARGIPYSPRLRSRIEQLCVREEQRFLARLATVLPRAAFYARGEFDESRWHKFWHESPWQSFRAFAGRFFRDWQSRRVA